MHPGSQIHGERRALTYNGGLGLCPSGVQGAKSLVRGSIEADEILASKTPYFALKSVRIDKKNLNTKLPQHESLCNNTVI